MKRLGVLSLFFLLLSGCAASSTGTPEETPQETQPSSAQSANIADGTHTLSVELAAYQGGSIGARDYVVMQAKQACDGIGKELYIENLTSETTWRGGQATLSFACVDKGDPRLKGD